MHEKNCFPFSLSQDWKGLSERDVGEVLFSNNRIAIPEAMSEEDLDGDQYLECLKGVLMSTSNG